VKLSDLRKGERAVIQSISGTELRLKLMEMGCLPGEVVIHKGKAPFGDPIAIEVQGYKLSLRLSEAESIKIVKLNHENNKINKV
jgi:ferrous iron transport protein A